MLLHSFEVRAWLADPGDEVTQARRLAEAGDPDWQRWIDEFERGEATLIDMHVEVKLKRDDGSLHTIAMENHQLWMTLVHHPPVAARLIAELSNKDLPLIASQIERLDERLGLVELDQMHPNVTLSDDLLAALRPGAGTPGARDLAHGARAGTETENGEHAPDLPARQNA